MNIKLYHDREIFAEAVGILMQHMPLDKLAHLIAAMQADDSDYSKIREELFAGETVDSLFPQIMEFQRQREH